MPHSFPPGSWSAAVLRLSQNSFWDHQMSPLDSSKCAISQMRAKNFHAERFLKLLRQTLLCRFQFGLLTGTFNRCQSRCTTLAEIAQKQTSFHLAPSAEDALNWP